MTTIPSSVIGNIDFLKEMYQFLEQNQADNRGFFQKDKSGETEDISGPHTNKPDFFGNSHKEANSQMEENSWDFYTKMYDMHRKKEIQKRMAKIRSQINREYQGAMIH